MNKCWKEAASIILTRRAKIFKINSMCGNNAAVSKSPDLKILVLKRGKTSKFFPGGYVFPGGTTESSDDFENWLDLFKYCNYTKNDLKKFECNPKMKATIFESGSSPQNSKSISLRITAIRETFEESGILLCKSRNCNKPSTWASYIADHDIYTWQKKVKNNAQEFSNLCKKYECFPDIWALHSWSNWLTPTNNPIRFDTAFFVATLDQLPPALMNEDEMDDIKWSYPPELIGVSRIHGANDDDRLWLPPPQFYEVSRLNMFVSIDHFNTFASEREAEGCERWMPVLYKANNGVISILPGDDLYPDNLDLSKKTDMEHIEGTMEELRKGRKKLHRMELHGTHGAKILVSNIEPSYGHIIPTESQNRNGKQNVTHIR